MAIVVIENNGEHYHFIVVEQMKECRRQRSLPFDQFQCRNEKKKEIYVMESANIYPTCVISIPRSANYVEIPENRFYKKQPMTYEQLQHFSNENESYPTFEKEEIINNWGQQRDTEISSLQKGRESASITKKNNITKTKLRISKVQINLRNSKKRTNLRNSKKRQRTLEEFKDDENDENVEEYCEGDNDYDDNEDEDEDDDNMEVDHNDDDENIP
jgi:hypothetical protein